MGTFDSIYQRKIRQLEEENRQLRKILREAPAAPPQMVPEPMEGGKYPLRPSKRWPDIGNPWLTTPEDPDEIKPWQMPYWTPPGGWPNPRKPPLRPGDTLPGNPVPPLKPGDTLPSYDQPSLPPLRPGDTL